MGSGRRTGRGRSAGVFPFLACQGFQERIQKTPGTPVCRFLLGPDEFPDPLYFQSLSKFLFRERIILLESEDEGFRRRTGGILVPGLLSGALKIKPCVPAAENQVFRSVRWFGVVQNTVEFSGAEFCEPGS